MINIKSPKEAYGNSVKIELFANGTKSCPVKEVAPVLGQGQELACSTDDKDGQFTGIRQGF